MTRNQVVEILDAEDGNVYSRDRVDLLAVAGCVPDTYRIVLNEFGKFGGVQINGNMVERDTIVGIIALSTGGDR